MMRMLKYLVRSVPTNWCVNLIQSELISNICVILVGSVDCFTLYIAALLKHLSNV